MYNVYARFSFFTHPAMNQLQILSFIIITLIWFVAKDDQPKVIQPSISSFVGGQGKKMTQAKLDNVITTYIASSVMPFNHVESNGFRYLVSELIPNFKESKLEIKSRKSYQHQLHTLWENKKKMMISSMTQARQVCLTVDHWSCRSKGYIGFTAHWFVDGNREQGAIALRRITERCTYDVIADQVYGVIGEFGLSGKVSHCVTDSGANFVKAFKVYFRLFNL